MNNIKIIGAVLLPQGFKAAAVHVGIKIIQKRYVYEVYSEKPLCDSRNIYIK